MTLQQLAGGQVVGAHTGWRVGDIEVDLASARVLLRGTPMVLDRSGYDLLLHLVEHAGRVVGKDELLQVGWPGRVVAENTLAKAVSKLRHAIGDDTGELIRVVHGYGYRLAAPATMTFAATPTVSTDSPASPMPRRRHGLRLALVVLGLMAIVGAWTWFSWSERRQATAASPAPATRASIGTSIAVLPFRDLSSDRSLGLLADGIGHHLRERMQTTGLRPLDPADAIARRDDRRGDALIARDLGADLLVGGEVATDANGTLRARLRVFDARGNSRMLDQAFVRAPAEQATLFDDITFALLTALAERADSTGFDLPRSTNHPDAHRALLRAATMHTSNEDPNGQRRAMAALEEAIRLDPAYADAWIELGYILGGGGYYADSREALIAGRKRGLAAMDRGIALKQANPLLYLARSEMRLLYRYDWQGAWADIQAAAARTPRGESASLLLWKARYLASAGRIDEAIALDARSITLEPNEGGRRNQGWHYLGKGDTRNARAVLMLQLRNIPENPHTNFYLALCDILDGVPQAALPRLEHSSTLFRLVGTAVAQHEMGDRAASDTALKKLMDQYSIQDGYWIAAVHAWRGEKDAAFRRLEQAFGGGDSSLMYLPFDPLMRNLRDDPRYAALLKRLRIPADPGFGQARARATTAAPTR